MDTTQENYAKSTDLCYAELGVAIVERAFEDFKTAYEKVLKQEKLSIPRRSAPCLNYDAKNYNNAIKFFQSPWAMILAPNLDICSIYIRLKRQFEDKYGKKYALNDYELLPERS